MKILIVAGFLGAGKTSFIQAMAKATGRQFVIVENEFGEVGIDGPLLGAQPGTEEDLKIWELSEGCICCSTNLDFSSTVLTIANTLDPDYLVVEPSGVALPGRILEQIRPICYERIGLLAPITILDADHALQSQKEFPEYFQDQLVSAGTLVLSKSENMSEEDFEEMRNRIGVPETADFPTEHYSRWETSCWTDLFDKEVEWVEEEAESEPNPIQIAKKVAAERAPASASSAGAMRPVFRMKKKKTEPVELLESISFIGLSFTSPLEMLARLNILISGVCGRVVRAKGFFHEGEHWYRFDLVDGLYALTGCEPMQDTRAVVIGKQLEREALKKLFTGAGSDSK